ncbi:MAG TPA: hypothetical protein VI730_03135 [Burkholderiales bacterium]|nr:hypothetical protein [Burkholderiales bacterium]
MKKRHPRNVKVPTQAIKDSRKVRIGGYSPNLPVRTAPAAVADSGKVRIGGYSPTL